MTGNIQQYPTKFCNSPKGTLVVHKKSGTVAQLHKVENTRWIQVKHKRPNGDWVYKSWRIDYTETA